MNNVASFEVLKDAASAAIYGSEGSNGVIYDYDKEWCKEGKLNSAMKLIGWKERSIWK